MGSAIEAETWQLGKVLDKINTNHIYLDNMNYWAPLDTIEEKDDTEEESINNTSTWEEKKTQETIKRTGNKRTRRSEGRKEKQREHKIIINSGATSHFMSPELNLPNTGPSNKEVYLPDDTKLMMANKTLLPFEQLSRTAREAEVLPGLKKSLASINKWSEEGYTTVFHPGKKRSNSPQSRNTHYDHQQTTCSPRIQTTWSKTIDNASKPRCKQTRGNTQCL